MIKPKSLAGAETVTKTSVYRVPPEDLVIVGLDTEDGPEHKRYDERVKLPVNPETVASIHRGWFGVVTAVSTKRGYEISWGRQRTRAARQVNLERVAKGLPPIRIKVEVAEGDDKFLQDAAIMENEVRQEDDSYTKAVKLKRYLETRTMAEATVAFGKKEATLLAYLKLLEMAPEAQEAVRTGEQSLATVLALRELPPERQVEALEMKQEAKAAGKKAPRVLGEAPTPSTRPGKREIARLANHLGGTAQMALLWSIGEVPEAAANEDPVFAKALAAGRAK